MGRSATTIRIAGVGMTKLGRFGRSVASLQHEALQSALNDAGLTMQQLDGLVAVPSLADPKFMEAHHLATEVGLLPNKNRMVRTIDTGGAGPVSGLLEAVRMIRVEQCEAVAVVAADAVSNLSTKEFLARADSTCQNSRGTMPSPVIPTAYDRVAQWHMQTYGLTRAQLALTSVFMSIQAQHHPSALTRIPHTLASVLKSPSIAPVTNLLECARRADGGAAIVVASTALLQRLNLLPSLRTRAVVVGGGESSGPLYPPDVISEEMFSCEEAARLAYAQAQLSPRDIDMWQLYDCFPICFVRAVEAVGLAPKGQGGAWVEKTVAMLEDTAKQGKSTAGLVPVNSHGGLLAFGAPWETPAMYNIIEAVQQLSGRAGERQSKTPVRRALVYGNGGVFSHSAVAILSQPVDDRY